MRHLVYGLNPLIGVLREHGIRIEPLLRESGISRKLLNNPESQLAPQKELAFWTRAQLALDLTCGVGLIDEKAIIRRQHSLPLIELRREQNFRLT